MEDDALEMINTPEIEILPPVHDDTHHYCPRSYLCCGRSQTFLDDDGCGICEECLSP
ncbi:hypothetical protein [Rhizobium sp. S163]|uniref:hypothetical protein n=1 Tax=Rhizobium sp. S163 TaxID=3055039 RepID=UPI0025A967A3|nr:hypothetical protein [Rhizobium sp. S163]MDM9646704.1 hypothetical protein [Rhizobium sp. S163]